MAATPKQTSFITSLLAERQVPDQVRAGVLRVLDDHRAKPGDVSRLIASLLAQPKLVTSVPAPAGRVANALLRGAGVPCAKYALDRSQIPLVGQGHLAGNDMGFYEVKEFKGVRYIRQLLGAPGAFSRLKLESDQGTVIHALIDAGPLAATQAFARHYKVCSCCGAELTQYDSRRLGMGPTCRKRFGL